jgi:[ribosomal protein S5]-alanine N-acetyltransferase
VKLITVRFDSGLAWAGAAPIGTAVHLETERLILRELAADDWRDIHVYTSDRLVVHYMSFGPYTPAEAQEWVNGCVSRAEEQPRRCYELAVVPRGQNRVIGDVTLESDQDQPRMGSFAYVLHRQYWRRGYATEAMRALFNFGFAQLNLHHIYDACDVRNLASAGA